MLVIPLETIERENIDGLLYSLLLYSLVLNPSIFPPSMLCGTYIYIFRYDYYTDYHLLIIKQLLGLTR